MLDFRLFFGGAHQFWASVAKGVGRRKVKVGRWQQLAKNCSEKLHSEDTDTRAVYS